MSYDSRVGVAEREVVVDEQLECVEEAGALTANDCDAGAIHQSCKHVGLILLTLTFVPVGCVQQPCMDLVFAASMTRRACDAGVAGEILDKRHCVLLGTSYE